MGVEHTVHNKLQKCSEEDTTPPIFDLSPHACHEVSGVGPSMRPSKSRFPAPIQRVGSIREDWLSRCFRRFEAFQTQRLNSRGDRSGSHSEERSGAGWAEDLSSGPREGHR
jgi:hypothetical protein